MFFFLFVFLLFFFEKSSSFCRENEIFKNKETKKTKKMDQFLTLEKAKIGPVFNSTAYIYIYVEATPYQMAHFWKIPERPRKHQKFAPPKRPSEGTFLKWIISIFPFVSCSLLFLVFNNHFFESFGEGLAYHTHMPPIVSQCGSHSYRDTSAEVLGSGVVGTPSIVCANLWAFFSQKFGREKQIHWCVSTSPPTRWARKTLKLTLKRHWNGR